MDTFNHWMEKDGVAIAFIIIGASLFYFIGGKIVSLLIAQIVKRKNHGQPRKDIEKRQHTLMSLVVNVWRTAVVVTALLSIFKILFPALNLSPLFASAGIVGIAIAFGSQTLVKDFLTGLFIVSENQYRVGDVVEINGAKGRVEQLGTRSTVIRDSDGNVHYLPNGSIVHVVNMTMGYSRVNFSLLLANSSDLAKVTKLINKTGQSLADDPEWKRKIIDAPQFDAIQTFTKSSIEVSVVGKVQPSDQWKVTAEMRQRLLEAFTKAGIELG
jgi:small conductance mechanosensitive channel